MTEREVLTRLEVTKSGHQTGDGYLVELADSREWGRLFSSFENNPELEPLEEDSTIENFDYRFEDQDQSFIISLASPLDEEKYTLTVVEE